MNRYILRRLLQALPLLLGISVASFAILKAVPGGPLAAYEASPDITDEDIRRLEHAFGLGDRLRHLILPVATISLVQLGSHVRYLRASMLETINQDYMRTARSKGLGERIVVLRHALKNAAIPLVTVVALDIPELFAGALVTEQIFGWPGMGRLFWDAATRLDYPILMGILAVSSTLIVLANLLADVVYGYLDPRIRYA